MRRVAYVLTVLGILCLAASQAQANGGHHGGYYGGYHGGGYHHGYYPGGVGFAQPVFVAPRFVAPVLLPPRVVYPPYTYRPGCVYRYYEPAPRIGFYYQGRGLSLGVGW
jgi:hypothetical protein